MILLLAIIALNVFMLFSFPFNSSWHLEQCLSQDWPVSAEVDLDDMEFHEGRVTNIQYAVL